MRPNIIASVTTMPEPWTDGAVVKGQFLSVNDIYTIKMSGSSFQSVIHDFKKENIPNLAAFIRRTNAGVRLCIEDSTGAGIKLKNVGLGTVIQDLRLNLNHPFDSAAHWAPPVRNVFDQGLVMSPDVCVLQSAIHTNSTEFIVNNPAFLSQPTASIITTNKSAKLTSGAVITLKVNIGTSAESPWFDITITGTTAKSLANYINDVNNIPYKYGLHALYEKQTLIIFNRSGGPFIIRDKTGQTVAGVFTGAVVYDENVYEVKSTRHSTNTSVSSTPGSAWIETIASPTRKHVQERLDYWGLCYKKLDALNNVCMGDYLPDANGIVSTFYRGVKNTRSGQISSAYSSETPTRLDDTTFTLSTIPAVLKLQILKTVTAPAALTISCPFKLTSADTLVIRATGTFNNPAYSQNPNNTIAQKTVVPFVVNDEFIASRRVMRRGDDAVDIELQSADYTYSSTLNTIKFKTGSFTNITSLAILVYPAKTRYTLVGSTITFDSAVETPDTSVRASIRFTQEDEWEETTLVYPAITTQLRPVIEDLTLDLKSLLQDTRLANSTTPTAVKIKTLGTDQYGG